jgi:molecular chaperone DnaK (HSP70)
MQRVVHDVERGKRAIYQSIYDWELTADLSGATAWRVAIPTNPFAERADWRDVRFDAALLREVFEKEVWERKLKRAIGDSLRRAKSELAGKEISIVLLSGGSANIRWMTLLLNRDFGKQLSGATVIELGENFQEIVAKGLAIECGRRFYTDGPR